MRRSSHWCVLHLSNDLNLLQNGLWVLWGLWDRLPSLLGLLGPWGLLHPLLLLRLQHPWDLSPQ